MLHSFTFNQNTVARWLTEQCLNKPAATNIKIIHHISPFLSKQIHNAVFSYHLVVEFLFILEIFLMSNNLNAGHIRHSTSAIC